MENKPKHDLRRNIFQVPEGYFGKLEADLINRTGRPSNETKEENRLVIWKPMLRIAAILVIGVAAWAVWPAAKSQTPEEILTDVDINQLSLYVEESTSLIHEDILLPAEEMNWDDLSPYADSI